MSSDFLDLFPVVELSPGGRPILKEEEVEIKWIDDVNIQTAARVDIFPSKTASIILTNMHIMVLLPPQSTRVCAWALQLKKILSLEDCASAFRSSKRIRFHMDDGRKIEIKFLAGHKESAMEIIQKSLVRKSWEKVTTQLPKPDESQFNVKSAGISGLIRRQEREHQSIDNVAREALTDLDALMNRAKEVVAVIERYASVRFEKSDDQSDTSSEIGDAAVLEGILLNIGIVSPVTRLSAGREYHQQLARQIADLLLANDRLRRLGGMITLSDVYCIYNRARGTELVSPEDLLEAASQLQHLHIGLKLRKFSSGVLVIQEEVFDDHLMFTRLVELAKLEPTEGVSPTTLSKSLRISILVAKEQLLLAEQNEYLCRDDTINGIFFFENRFRDQ